MKLKPFLLLTLLGALLIVLQNFFSGLGIGQAYFFLSLLLVCFCVGLDILSPFLKIFPSAWGQKSLTLLQEMQKLRYPALLFLILGFSVNFNQLQLHHGYFSVNPFLFRQVLFVLLIVALPQILPRIRQVSALFTLFLGALLLYSLFFVDWEMLFFSPWHSTIFPLLMCSICVSAVVGSLLCLRSEITEMARLGIAVLIFTLYLHFGQFLIIWQARLPKEMEWYEVRTIGAYGLICILMLSIKYLLPLVLLFFRERIERIRPSLLSGGLVIIGVIVELAWIYQIV